MPRFHAAAGAVAVTLDDMHPQVQQLLGEIHADLADALQTLESRWGGLDAQREHLAELSLLAAAAMDAHDPSDPDSTLRTLQAIRERLVVCGGRALAESLWPLS